MQSVPPNCCFRICAALHCAAVVAADDHCSPGRYIQGQRDFCKQSIKQRSSPRSIIIISVVRMAPVKRKHVTLTIKQKVEICKKLERGVKVAVIKDEYGIGDTTVYDIKKSSAKLQQFMLNSESEKGFENRKTLHTAKLHDLDSALYKWFSLKRSEGAAISGPMLIEKGKDFYEKMKLTEPCTFSEGWLTRFKDRHGIRKLDVSGEQKSADVDAADEFRASFVKLVTENDLTLEQVYNADESGLLWKCLPKTTLAGGNETSAPGFKQNKERLTVLVCANAAGTHRVQLTVIGKYAKPRCLKNVTHLPVDYRAQSNAWMSAEIFLSWFNKVFVPSVKENLRDKGMPEDSKVVLLLDNCRAHPCAQELKKGNISAVFLPPNVTSLIQPMDQGVIQNLKMLYRRDFMRQLTNYDGNITEFLKKYNLKDAIFNVSCAWSSVKNETLHKAWRKIWPTTTVEDVTDEDNEEDFLGFGEIEVTGHTDSPYGEIIQMVECADKENPLNKLSATDINEWLQIDNEIPVSMSLTTEEIVEAMRNPCSEQESSGDESDDGSDKTDVTWNEAAAAWDTVIKFSKSKKNCFSISEVMQCHILHSTFLHKRRQAIKQSDIRAHMVTHETQKQSLPSASTSRN